MRKLKMLLIILLLIVLTVVWVAWSNFALVTTIIEVKQQYPELDGFKIVQLSDLHNYEFGEGNENLIKRVEEEKPNIIAITGDFVDTLTNFVDAPEKLNKTALDLAEKLTKIAPTYYVTGNHESGVVGYKELMEELRKRGVEILDNRVVKVEYNNTYINIAGILDPSDNDYSFAYVQVCSDRLDEMMKDLTDDYYTVLLAHRPEYINVYSKYDIDLVLSGHIHGGQFRIPFLGGVVSPNREFFPKYDSGLYQEGNTNMIVSRGLGSSSSLKVRINNRPEVVSIVLRD